jgi:hypothetical protein
MPKASRERSLGTFAKTMRRFTLTLIIAFLASLAGCDLAKTISSSSFTTAKSPVLKVYSASDGGHKYVAYVVDVGGNEVVISDPLGKSSYKVGDSIEYMAQKIEVAGGRKVLSYTLQK